MDNKEREENVLLIKSHVKGYMRNGVWVGEYDNKVAKKPDFGHKKVLFNVHTEPKEPPEGHHPQRNDKGDKVAIQKLSKSTPVDTWADKDAVATVTPHDSRAMPKELNGIEFHEWLDVPTSLHEWADVEGQNEIDEPDFEPVKGMAIGSGVIVQEPDGRVWVVHPTNRFGGYNASFPKGTLEDGLPLQASAIKEAYEESGLKVEITGFFDDVVRTTSVARYYTAKRVGGDPSTMGWESQAVSLVPPDKLGEIVNHKVDIGLVEKINK
jgi:ADP-ribose pyrophosphatase YjhB (NUDIX family)